MSTMTDAEVEFCIEALDRVPGQPSYADRALNRLAAEVRRARAEEKRLREALNNVKRAVQDVET
jgi:hypothetical protein